MATNPTVPHDSLFNDEARRSIQRRLDTLTSSSKGLWGRMTVNQMLCHLSDAYRVPTGERACRPSGKLVHHTLLRWVALHTPMTWPKGAKTAPDLDQAIGGTKPTDFDQDLAELRRLVDKFASTAGDVDGVVHPIFGTLTTSEWGRWGYRHADHHLRQFGV